MRLPARMGDRVRSPRRAANLARLLQPPAASRRPRRTTAGRGLPLRHDDHATRPRGPDSSLETARSCPTSREHHRETVQELHRRPPNTINELLRIEGRIAAIYFNSWRSLEMKWKGLKRHPVPDEWQSF